MSMWDDMFIDDDIEVAGKPRRKREPLTDFQKDRMREKRAASQVVEQPPRVPKAMGKDKALYEEIRAKDHMKPIPVAPDKPVLAREAPIRVPAERVDKAQEIKSKRFQERLDKFKKKIDESE